MWAAAIPGGIEDLAIGLDGSVYLATTDVAVATIGILFVVQQGVLMAFGPDARPVDPPFYFRIEFPWFGYSGYKLMVVRISSHVGMVGERGNWHFGCLPRYGIETDCCGMLAAVARG